MSARESWEEEKRSAYLYRAVAAAEKDTSRQSLFLKLADEADKQAATWAKQLSRNGEEAPTGYHPDARAQIVTWLIGRFGPSSLRPILAAMKVRGMSIYSGIGIDPTSTMHAAELERRHNAIELGGNLRAGVFGISDGITSNVSLIMGMAGAGADHRTIVLSGTAGLLAGAFSMAAGEYISVRSQRELYEHQIELEEAELKEYPEAEAAELALIYEAKGLSKQEAWNFAKKLMADPDRALDTLAREELGLNPSQLGSPWGAAISSLLAFALGATLPLFPFVLLSRGHPIMLSAITAGFSLLLTGAVLSLFTGRRMAWSAFRMLLIACAAAGTTYLIGHFLGTAI